MNIILFGAAGFIGTNLTFALAMQGHNVKVVSTNRVHCVHIEEKKLTNGKI